jgi:hypothetical protein
MEPGVRLKARKRELTQASMDQMGSQLKRHCENFLAGQDMPGVANQCGLTRMVLMRNINRLLSAETVSCKTEVDEEGNKRVVEARRPDYKTIAKGVEILAKIHTEPSETPPEPLGPSIDIRKMSKEDLQTYKEFLIKYSPDLARMRN